MIGVKWSDAKSLFLDRGEVGAAVRRANKDNLFKAGFTIRKIARRSLKNARKARRSDFTPQELADHEKIRQIAAHQGRKVGKWPYGRVYASSAKGDPPRMIPALGFIRKALFTIWSPSTESTVTGSALLNGKSKTGPVPGRLESKQDLDRPYMEPAYTTAEPYLAKVWRNTLKP